MGSPIAIRADIDTSDRDLGGVSDRGLEDWIARGSTMWCRTTSPRASGNARFSKEIAFSEENEVTREIAPQERSPFVARGSVVHGTTSVRRSTLLRLGWTATCVTCALRTAVPAEAFEDATEEEAKMARDLGIGADGIRKIFIPKTPAEFVWEILGIVGTLGTGLWTGLILHERRRALEDLVDLRKIAEERLRQSEEQRHEVEIMQRTAEEQWRKSEKRVRQLQASLQELVEQGVVEAGAKMAQLQKELRESEASLLAATLRLNEKNMGSGDQNLDGELVRNDLHEEKLVVPDTNCYLTELAAVRRLKFTDAQVVIPTVVISELDGLQNSNESQTAFQARKALRYLSGVLSGGGKWLRGQEEKELRLMIQKPARSKALTDHPNLEYMPQRRNKRGGEDTGRWHQKKVSSPWYTSEGHEHPDNALIEVSLSLAMQGSNVTLLTADKALQVKAMLYGIQSMPAGQFLRKTLENTDF